MKNNFYMIVLAMMVAVTMSACDKRGSKDAVCPVTPGSAKQGGVSDAACPVGKGETKEAAGVLTGKIIETMNSGSYTYIQLDTGSAKEWAAIPACEVKVGDTVSIAAGMTMANFTSPTLKRTFAAIRFSEGLIRPGAAGASPAGMPAGHPAIGGDAGAGMPAGHPGGMGGGMQVSSAPAVTNFEGIAKPEGGKSVTEIYAEKAALATKTVTLRGKVVKYNEGIMQKNWLHLRDGTGKDGDNDITVTTNDKAAVGKTVLVSGTVTLDKDFGYGYKYPVIIENGKVTVE